jgi:DNA-binding transcriptional ArsR family regulator
MLAGELSEAFAMTKGSLSHHINILKNADLVRRERRGQFQVYSLNTSAFEETPAMLIDLFGSDKKRKRSRDSPLPRKTGYVRAMRHRNVYFLRGGINEWLEGVMPDARSQEGRRGC